METRPMYGPELVGAVNLARYTYENSIEEPTDNPMQKQFFLQYVEANNIINLVDYKRLVVFGTFNDVGELVAVSAINSMGYITMLYILPQYQWQGIGKRMIRIMELYAYSNWKLNSVRINVTPANRQIYFANRGFMPMNVMQGGNMAYCEMFKPIDFGKNKYISRPLNKKVTAAVICSGLVLCNVFAWICCII